MVVTVQVSAERFFPFYSDDREGWSGWQGGTGQDSQG